MSDSLLKISNNSLSQSAINQKDITALLSSLVTENDLLQQTSKFKILEFVKVIGRHKGTADEIKELKNGFFASFGTDNKLMIYNKDFNLKLQGEDLGEWIYHILEITSQEKIERDIQIIVCTNKCLYLNQINVEKNTSRIQRYECGGVICLEIKKNNYVICSEEGVDHFSDLFSKIIQSKKNRLFEKSYRDGLVLNQNLVAFSSNKVLPKGEDSLKFYNPNSKKVTKEIVDKYSFIVSSNGLFLMESGQKDLNKIFLAACKKYYDNQSNGILIVTSLFDESDAMNEKFYPTDNFEAFCFCHLSIVKIDNSNERKILDNKEKVESIKTNYFLVGGFDEDSRCGLIKLYKANFGEDSDDTYIEFIQDIEIEKVSKNQEENPHKEKKVEEQINNEDDAAHNKNNENSIEKENISSSKNEKFAEYQKKLYKERNTFNGFVGPVSSIIQSSLTGHILATCYDGHVYLFTPPNLEYYLEKDKEEK